MTTTLSNPNTATLRMDGAASLTIVMYGKATIDFTSANDDVWPSFTVTNAQSKTYGPYGINMSVVITALDGSLTYQVNGGVPGIVDARTYGAVGTTGLTDDRPFLQAYIDAVQLAGGGVIELPPGNFGLGKSSAGKWALRVTGNKITIRGTRATKLRLLDSAPIDTPLLRVEGSDIEIYGFEIDGNKARLAGNPAIGSGEDEGIDVKGTEAGGTTQRCFIHHMWVHHCGQDGIDIDAPASQSIVTDCIVEDCGGGGVHTSSDRAVVNNNMFSRNGVERYAIGGNNADETATVGGFARNWVCVGNEFKDDVRPFQLRNVETASDLAGLTVIGNKMEVGPAVSVAPEAIVSATLSDLKNCVISGNYINGWQKSIVLSRINANSCIVISSNVLLAPTNAAARCVAVDGVGGTRGELLVSDNVMRAAGGRCIEFTGVRRYVISGNFFQNATQNIRLDASPNGLVTGNYVNANGQNGIRLVGVCDEVTISNNDIMGSASQSVAFEANGSSVFPTNIRLLGNNLPQGVLAHASVTGLKARGNTGFVTEAGGTNTQNGTGAATSFSIAHGLVAAPTDLAITPGSQDAAEIAWVSSVDGTNITRTFSAAPIVGTGNVIHRWRAACYQ